MAGILPDPANGGVVIRDSNGTCLSPPQVSGAYCPPAEFASNCDLTALPSNCTARISAAQINGIVSEIMCLAASMNPEGSWNCGFTCNLSSNFLAWAANTNNFDGVTIIGDGSIGDPYRISATAVATALCSDPAGDSLAACLISTNANNSIQQGTDGRLLVPLHLVNIIPNPAPNVAFREVFSNGTVSNNMRVTSGTLQESFFFSDSVAGSLSYSAAMAALPNHVTTLNNPYADRDVTAYISGSASIDSISWNGTNLNADIRALVNGLKLSVAPVRGTPGSSGGLMTESVTINIAAGGSTNVTFAGGGTFAQNATGNANGSVVNTLYTVKYVPFTV